MGTIEPMSPQHARPAASGGGTGIQPVDIQS
jgi:hypothetical protein